MKLHKLARALGLTADVMIKKWQESVPPPLDGNVEPYSEVKVQDIPTFDMAVAAGPWVQIGDGAGQGFDDREVNKVRGVFRIRIRGDSMERVWPDGSLVEFRCLREEGATVPGDKLEVGQDYYVQRIDDATFKRLDAFDEEELVFRAVNRKKYPSLMIVRREEITRMARAEYMLTPRKGSGLL